MQNVLFDNTRTKLEIGNKMIILNIWELNTSLLNNPWVLRDNNTKETRNILNWNLEACTTSKLSTL